MRPARERSKVKLLRAGVAVLLAVSAGGAIPTELTDLAGFSKNVHTESVPFVQEGDNAMHSGEPFEQIHWHTRPTTTLKTKSTNEASPFKGNPIAVADSNLDEIRGGFEFPEASLKVSFGIERAVFINGQLVASSVLNFKDLQWTSGAGAVPEGLPEGTNGIGLLQNGPGNSISAQLGESLAGTIIQNTLNNQSIGNVTTINARVNSVQMMRSMVLHSAIQDAIVSSLGK